MTTAGTYTPLAVALRPQNLDEIVGQQHLVAKGEPLRVAYESGLPHSMIFWGPPGVGKTTLASLAGQYFNAKFIAISAVFAGVKDLREIIHQAESNQAQGLRTIVFIDEIHRFNKSQQDALLPYTESGLITIIGATTENPSFEVNRALLSRTHVYVLKPLCHEDLQQLFTRAWSYLFKDHPISIGDEIIQTIIHRAGEDARRLLNLIELLAKSIQHLPPQEWTREQVEKQLCEQIRGFDKGGDLFYDQISALHKSVRGSDPDAALYWLTRMLDGGIDRSYLVRRMIRMAWEDIGLADPRAIAVANDAAETYERLGSPEGELAIASAIIYLSIAAKSNRAYLAHKKAVAFVKSDVTRDVPIKLRNAPTALMKDLAYGQAYRYAHDEPYAYAAGEHYWPDNLPPQTFYTPSDRGLEKKIGEKLAFLDELDQAYKLKSSERER